MKMTVKDLKTMILEAKVAASPQYMKKERVREKLQELVIDAVAAGQVETAADLATYFADIVLALTTLKSVPIEVWQKMATMKQ